MPTYGLNQDAPAVPALGIPAYHWWNEALHGVARNGVATVFAAVNPELIQMPRLPARTTVGLCAEVAAVDEAVAPTKRAKNKR